VAVAYDLAGRVLTVLGLNYFVCPFVALGYDYGVTAWASFYYIGHIVALGLVAALALVPPVPGGGRKGAAASGRPKKE
jgi:hypothetical protein